MGPVTALSTVSASAPGRFALTWIVGGAIFGKFSIGSSGKAIKPASKIKMLHTVLSTGRRMKVSERLIDQPALCLQVARKVHYVIGPNYRAQVGRLC